MGRQALDEAFEALFAIPTGFDGLDFAGATDHDLWTQVAAKHAVNPSQHPIFFARYVLHLRHALAKSPLAPLPGVVSLVTALAQEGWPQVLGTGNIRAGAYAKLSAAGLAPYFPTGGFSTPTLDRPALIRSAMQGYQSAVVIGDTPKDIDAAHANRLPVIAVATGRFAVTTLRERGADLVLPDLTSRQDVMDAIHTI